MKLSIVVPIYNSESKLHVLLDSIMKSKLEFEVICVNDGSTDNSVEKLQDYADDRIKVFNKENEGTFKAWQFGLRQAVGDYVTILDQDDYIDEDYLEYIFQFINSINADVLVTPYYVEEENGSRYVSELGVSEGLYEGDKLTDIYDKLLGGRIPYAKFTKVVRRTLYMEQVESTCDGQLRDFEDWLTIVEVFAKAKSIYVLNHAFYHYIQYSNSVSKSTISYRRNYESLKTIIDFLRDNRPDKMSNDNYCSFCFYALNILLNKCMTIHEWDLAEEIVKHDKYHGYILKSKLGIRRKIFLYFSVLSPYKFRALVKGDKV